jgi:hypothetical protein
MRMLCRFTGRRRSLPATGSSSPDEIASKGVDLRALVNADETTVQVLDEPGRANTTTATMWVFRGGSPRKEAVLYRYSPTRSCDIPRESLQGYRGQDLTAMPKTVNLSIFFTNSQQQLRHCNFRYCCALHPFTVGVLYLFYVYPARAIMRNPLEL